ncbi:VC0807 family protein [Jeotgalibacillus proteolyticus]|uniref:VC0807 family protein n=1 Tax=Jeotgalibacillus proteolyticus TaxID=2082395 RepID=UPI001ADA7B95|nr:VC0807 family protein [Jeotgalibacillus proteolyticus]
MKKFFIILDILCYGVIPYLIWSYGRESLGDYWAIILSTVPGIIYTVYRFASERQLNIMGIFILGNLGLGTIVNLLSSSAESMLWNQVYLGLFFTSIIFYPSLLKSH